jgi:hypothetical protein
VSLNGQSIDGSSGAASNPFSSLVSLFAKFFGGSPAANGDGESSAPVQRVAIWGVSTGGATTPEPAGTILRHTVHPGHGHHARRMR